MIVTSNCVNQVYNENDGTSSPNILISKYLNSKTTSIKIIIIGFLDIYVQWNFRLNSSLVEILKSRKK